MKSLLQVLAPGGAALALLLSSPVRADAIDDIQRGTDLYLQSATVRQDTPYSAQDYVLPKVPGTLNMTLSARAFGVDSDAVLHLYGTRVGDTIEWRFNETLPTPFDLGWWHYIDRVEGYIVARATQLDPAAQARCSGAPCAHNVRLDDVPGGYFRVYGRQPFGSILETIYIDNFVAFAGLPRPKLADFSVRAPIQLLCVGTAPRYLTGEVRVDSIAPSGGTWVSITTSAPHAVMAGGVRVPEGQQRARFRFSVASGFSGGVVMTASAGGTSSSQVLTLKKEFDCQAFYNVARLRDLFIQPWRLSTRGLNNASQVLATVDGEGYLLRPEKEPVLLAKQLGAYQVTPVAINEHGEYVGQLSYGGEPLGFLARADSGDKPLLLKDFIPAGLNDRGQVVGTRKGYNGQVATLFNGEKQVDLPLKNAWTSTAVSINNAGQVAGTLDEGKGPRAYRFFEGDLRYVADLGGGSSEARGMNEQGHVVGRALTASGQWMGFVSLPEQQKVVTLKPLYGLPNSQANAINEAGWVVGSSYDTKSGKSYGFIYTPSKGVVDLNTWVDPGAKLEVLEGLSLNDEGHVLVRARRDGIEGHYLLAP